MSTIDLFAQKFNALLELDRANGLYKGKSLEYLPDAEKYEGIQYYLRGYSSHGVPGFYWFSPWKVANFQMPGNLLWVASCPAYNLEYVLDTATGEVTTFDLEHYALEWPCAINYESFFKSLLIILDNETEKAVKKTFDLDQSVLMARYQECMKINGYDQKFSTFYEHILGVELNG
ncbi:MAG: hypothetical protein ACK5V5_10375 [Cyclobacteriaceae bacterium]|jgi:hypothetical protein